MKKRTIFCLALLVGAVLIAGTVYKRPMTLPQLCPEIPLDACTGITAYYAADEAGEDDRVVFPAESEAFDLLLEQIRQPAFRRSLKNAFPLGDRSHLWAEGDFKWEILLEFVDPIPTEDGSTSSGMLLRLNNFFGDLTIDNLSEDRTIRCHAKDQQQWAEAILHILSGE